MFLRSLHRTEQLTVLQCFDSFTQDISQAREIVWHGRMRGPFCEFSRTLPTNYAVQPDGQIRVIDPCYWTPALPFQYEVLVGTAEHPVEIDSRPSRGDASQLWGIRNLLAHRGNLMLGAKRFVFRGVGLSDEAVFDFQGARNCSATAVLPSPSDTFCRQATQFGIPVIADLRETADPINRLSELQTFAAAQLAIVPSHLPVESSPKQAAGDILLAVEFTDPIPTWADVVVCSLAEIPAIGDATHEAIAHRPILVTDESLAPYDGPTDLESSRKRCDALQACAASHGQFAGYLCLSHDQASGIARCR